MSAEMYLRRRNKVIVREGIEKRSNTIHIATLLKNLENLGYTLSQKLIERLHTIPTEELGQFYSHLTMTLRSNKGGHVYFNPLYPNFPQQVMEASDAELYMNSLLYYISGGELFPEYEKEAREKLDEYTKLTVIDLGNEHEYLEIYKNLIGSKTSISETDKEDIKWFVENAGPHLELILPEEIPLKENVAYVGSLILKYVPEATDYLFNYIKTATDVLRLAVAMSDGDVSLAEDTKFISFKRSQRRLLMNLLDYASNIEEDMLRYKFQWIRLGERLHPAEFKNKYLKAQEAFRKIRRNEYIGTFGKTFKSLEEHGEWEKLIDFTKERPGELARRLDHLIRISEDGGEKALRAFTEVADQVAVPVLLQVMKHFEKRNEQNLFRSFFPKGNTAKVYTIENELPEISVGISNLVTMLCQNILMNKFSERESLGKVYLDPKLKDYLVPFSQRSASRALKTIVRGSKIDIPEHAKTIRSFVYWKQPKGETTDIDLSAVILDENWNHIERIYYGNMRHGYSNFNACHSGDYTSAPNGASEFIDIDIDSLREYGGRFIVTTLQVYNGPSFVNQDECFTGWMFRNKPNSGEVYEPKTVANKIDITTDTDMCIPMIIDLYENKVIWVDIASSTNPNYVNNVVGNSRSIVAIGQALTSLVKPTLYDLLYLHGTARGEFVDNPKDADTVFSVDKGITPFDTDVIMAQYL